jgi:hypothetical protein
VLYDDCRELVGAILYAYHVPLVVNDGLLSPIIGSIIQNHQDGLKSKE